MGKIKKNLFYNIAYQILILIVPLITTPYVSRILLPEGVGKYAITFSIAKYFVLFGTLGMTSYGNRKIAKCKNQDELNKEFSSLFYFQLLCSLFTTILFTFFLIVYGFKKYDILLICQIPYVITSIFEISWFYYGKEEFKFMVIRNAIIKIITAISVFIFVRNESDLYIYILINSMSLLIGQLCLWPFLLKKVKFVKVSIQDIYQHLKPNLILFVSVVAVSIYTLMDKIMIEIFSNTIELGYYENSYKIMDICCSIVGAIGAVMLPRMSSLMAQKKDSLIKDYIGKSMNYIMILSIAISFGMASIAIEFSQLYFGISFYQSGFVMIAIAPTIILYSWENIIKNQYLLPYNKDKIFVKATIFAAITNIILNLLFIKIYGAVGASIGTVGALLVASMYQTISIRHELPIRKYLKKLIPFIFLGFAMFFICRVASTINLSKVFLLFVEILIGGLFYIICSYCILYYRNDPIIKNLNILKKK